jgi:hypothetical protein
MAAPTVTPEQAGCDLQDRTLPTPLIDDGAHPKRPAIGERIVDEIHAPTLGWADGSRRGTPMQGDVFAAADPHPQLQPVQPVQPTHAFLIHRPSFASQQHPDPREPEPWPRMRQFPNA